MENQIDVKETFELVSDEKEFLQWLDAVYSLMFEEIGTIVIAKTGGTFSERMKAYDAIIDKHMVGMECMSQIRSKLSWELFEKGDMGAMGLLDPKRRDYRTLERERTIKTAEAPSNAPNRTFYR